VLAGFVAVLLCSNLIGPAKVGEIALPFALPFVGATLVFGAGNLFFPISYIFGDILTGSTVTLGRARSSGQGSWRWHSRR
jgi:hypothetical protein